MKLVLQPDVYPLTFVIWGGCPDFNGFFEELQKHKVHKDKISEVMNPMIDDMDHTAGFRLDFGHVQAVFCVEKLTWKTLDTYNHELLHAVWAGMDFLGIEDQEAWAYMMDYLTRNVAATKYKK